MPYYPPPPPPKKKIPKALGCIGLFLICGALGGVLQALGYVSPRNTTATAQALADLQRANAGATATVVQSSANGTAEANQQALAATEAARPTVPPTITPTPGPTRTPAPTKTPAPTRTAVEGLSEFLERALGDGNRGLKRLQTVQEVDGGLVIQWAINDNLTSGLVKFGAKRDVKDLLQTVDQSNIAYEFVILQGTFSLKDTFGNTAEQASVLVQYNRATVERINFAGIDIDTIYLIADDISLVPAFRD
jgi:hypothetical protein